MMSLIEFNEDFSWFTTSYRNDEDPEKWYEDQWHGQLRPNDENVFEIDGNKSIVHGTKGILKPCTAPVYLANSGTSMRLLSGLLAGQPFDVELVGDHSLMGRPMRRVTGPLAQMGARIETTEQGTAPLRIRGGQTLQGLDNEMPVASAQVKSAVLLAGLFAEGKTTVTEPFRSRDHTERLLGAVGAPVISHATEGGWRVELREPPGHIRPLDFAVPGDLSSAAFLFAVAALGGMKRPSHRWANSPSTRSMIVR